MNITLIKLDTIDSTNTEALKHAKLGADEGVCIVARRQTAGRGRYGRTWISEIDSGIYLSIVLRPAIDLAYLPLITLMTAVAVSDMLTSIGLRPDIKWANDVMIGEKKVAGILAETAESEHGLAVVAGIGINLRPSNFPPEIAAVATSVEAELGRPVSGDEIIGKLIKKLIEYYDGLQSIGGPALIVTEWQRRSSYYSGKQVRATVGGETFSGVTDGLEPNGSLRIITAGENLRIIQTGEVERLRALEYQPKT